jgi:hypothetical protein
MENVFSSEYKSADCLAGDSTDVEFVEAFDDSDAAAGATRMAQVITQNDIAIQNLRM